MPANQGYKTAQERVVEFLREAIAAQKLKPGQRIPQDDVARQLGVSRMPIREALRQLEVEGFVTYYPHRGVVVTDVSIEDIEDIYVIRTALEATATRLGAESITDNEIIALENMLGEMEALRQPIDPSVWLKLNQDFHGVIYRAAKRPRLYKLINSANLTTAPYIKAFIMRPEYLKKANEEHRDILEAVKRRDGARAEEIVKAQLSETRDSVIEYLRRLAS